MDAIIAFAAALLALRLAGDLARRWRTTRRPELAWWAWSLAAYAIAAAAIAWGESAGWDARAFRVYYAAGALLTAPLLGAGSLVLAGVRRVRGPALLFAVAANVLGTLAVVVVALRSIHRRPLGNSLIILGVAAAATGSGLAGLGAAGTALGIAVGAALLYAGFVLPAALRPGLAPLPD